MSALVLHVSSNSYFSCAFVFVMTFGSRSFSLCTCMCFDNPFSVLLGSLQILFVSVVLFLKYLEIGSGKYLIVDSVEATLEYSLTGFFFLVLLSFLLRSSGSMVGALLFPFTLFITLHFPKHRELSLTQVRPLSIFLFFTHLILALTGGCLLSLWCLSFLVSGGDLFDISSRKSCENFSLIPGIMVQMIQIHA